MLLTANERPSVLGKASRPTCRAWIYWQRLDKIAAERIADIGDFLGKVIAHEMGHLGFSLGHSGRLDDNQPRTSMRSPHDRPVSCANEYPKEIDIGIF